MRVAKWVEEGIRRSRRRTGIVDMVDQTAKWYTLGVVSFLLRWLLLQGLK
jgi:hypothetical protein